MNRGPDVVKSRSLINDTHPSIIDGLKNICVRNWAVHSVDNASMNQLILNGYTFFYTEVMHDDVIIWKHFPRNWPFVRGIHRSPVNSPYKGQWRGALVFCLICAWINGWVNNGEAGDLRRHYAHCDVIEMWKLHFRIFQINIEKSISHFLALQIC